MENLTYKKMQEMLPDYVFGNLGEDKEAEFEQNLPLYPDLQKEVAEARKVFNRLEDMDIDGEIRRRTANMSVKVNNKLEKYGSRKSKPNFMFRFLAPSLGLAFIILVLAFPDSTRNFVKSAFGVNMDVSDRIVDSTFYKVLDPKYFNVIFDSTLTVDDIAEEVDNSPQSLSLYPNEFTLPDNELESSLDNLISEIYTENLKTGAGELDEIYIPDYRIIDGLQYLDENDLQKILKEMSNEKINS